MTILVTGAAGFIGKLLCERLTNAGHTVVGLDNLSEQVHGKNTSSVDEFFNSRDITLVKGDVRDIQLVTCIFNNYKLTAIYHLAAETGTGQSMYEVTKYCDTNITGCAVLLECIANSKRLAIPFFLASSRSVYGEGAYQCVDHGLAEVQYRKEADLKNGLYDPRCAICSKFATAIATKEQSTLNPISQYAVTKRCQEDLVQVAHRAGLVKAIIFRLQNVVGAGQSLENPYTGILAIFTQLLKSNSDIEIFEDGLESRDFIHVSDVVTAMSLFLKSQPNECQIINVGTGTATSVMELVRILQKKLRSDSKIVVSGRFRIGDIRHNFADISRLTQLGFLPQFDIYDIVEEFLDWTTYQKLELRAERKYKKSIEELEKHGLLK